jgi:ATP-dependent DNA helicase DinG
MGSPAQRRPLKGGRQPIRVSIDLETTGLQPETETIIEIAAVKFQGAAVLDTFHTLVATRRPIPYRVQRLTGITAADLEHAPPFEAVAPRLSAFLGHAALVGHSVPFDAAFLRKRGLALENPLLDTFELATVLLPALPNYTLERVAEALHLGGEGFHRAMADAMLAKEVFVALLERIGQLEMSVLEELEVLSGKLSWPLLALFAEERRSRPRGPAAPSGWGSVGGQLAAKLGIHPQVFSLGIARPAASAPPAAEAAPPVPAAAEAAQDRIITPASQQDHPALAAAIQGAFEAPRPLLLEIEPDAHSLPQVLLTAIGWAQQHQQRLIIAATNPLASRRLVQEVLPGLQAQLPRPASVTLLAEEENYLCLHRWFGAGRLPRNGDFPPETTRGLAKLTLWLHHSTSGLRDELVLVQQEQSAWPLVRSGREYLTGLSTCRYAQNGYCFVSRSHQAAASADVVVTTHAALLDYLASGDAVLAQATNLLILDARNLEEEAFRQGAYELEHPRLKRLLDELLLEKEENQASGLLLLAMSELERMQKMAPAGRGAAFAESRLASWQPMIGEARQAMEHFFSSLALLLTEQAPPPHHKQHSSSEGVEASLRVNNKVRNTPGWKSVEQAWAELERTLLALTSRLEKLALALEGRAEAGESGRAGGAPLDSSAPGVGLAVEISGVYYQLQEMIGRGRLIMTQPRREMVYWVKPTLPPLTPRSPATTGYVGPKAETPPPAPLPPSLNAAPMHAAPLLQQTVFRGERAAVLVDTALTVDGQFEFAADHLGLAPERVATLSTAPARRPETLLYLPEDVAEPNTSRFQRHLDDLIMRVATALGGETVVMCASHAALRASYANIKATLEERGILVLAQGPDGSIRQIWQTYRTQGRTVILGAGSFWENNDFPGEGPACVIIPRLPFPPLSDPAQAGRADGLQDQLRQYVLPQATLKLRQGLNRLAWGSGRRNAIVLFDKRVQAKDYGAVLQNSLPRCTVRQGSTAQVPDQVVAWVRGEPLEELPRKDGEERTRSEPEERPGGEAQDDSPIGK